MCGESSPRRRTGGRSAMVLTSIRKAVEELVAEQGSNAVTIPMVAERAPWTLPEVDVRSLVDDLCNRSG